MPAATSKYVEATKRTKQIAQINHRLRLAVARCSLECQSKVKKMPQRNRLPVVYSKLAGTHGVQSQAPTACVNSPGPSPPRDTWRC
jgi:hypothetical protein